jgi:hypothetical protein
MGQASTGADVARANLLTILMGSLPNWVAGRSAPQVTGRGEGEVMRLIWRPIGEPGREGFGARITKMGLGGTGKVDFR